MRNGLKNALVLLMALCMVLLCAPGLAESGERDAWAGELDMEVTVGFGGMMTYGKTMPVRVRIRNYGDDFDGVLGMNAFVDKKDYDRYEKEVFVPAGAEREFELAICVYTRQDRFTAELVKDGETVCTADGTANRLVNPAAMLVGVLSTRPQNLNNLNIDRENDVLGRYELWQTVPLTADTFPESSSLMNSFAMLVVDDIDPAALTQKQQEILDAWLRGGRILICGGGANAARNAAFFGKYTGLKLEGVAASESVMEGLEQTIGRSLSGKRVSTTLAEFSGAQPLGRDAENRGLVWRTTVGGGRIYTAAFEAGDPRLNSEGLMHYFWQQLLVNQDADTYTALTYAGDGASAATVTGGYSTTIEAKSHLLTGLLIVLGVLILSCVCWAVLKRKDRRQWMWLVLPVIAVTAAAGILLLSTAAETNRPLAVIADNLVQDSSGAIRDYSGISVAAPTFGRHSYSLGAEKLRLMMYDYVDYDEDEEDEKNREPDTLRTCYQSGGENAVTAESTTPWEMVNLSAERLSQTQGRITGAIWMEEDGLHGEVVNETDTAFGAGRILTTYGYVSVSSLAPGEKAGFVLTRQKMKDPDKPKYEDGGFYPEQPGFYSVVSNAVGYDDTYTSATPEEARERELAGGMINSAADVLRQGRGNYSYGAYETALFLYSAKPLQAEETALKVDGEEVTQKTGMTLLTAELAFTAVGRTGVVYRSAGMDIPERVETDENRMPTEERVQNGKQLYYHTLNENPTFLFALDGMEGVDVKKMQVLIDSYYARQARAYALNMETRDWEEIKLNEDIKAPGRFLNAEGRLYLQFRDASGDMYADIPTPMITLEGRLEHAEN